ncbi:Progesterone-induced-blocking factor 1 [Brachionus plicatilis]|uniref:Progesterone-induced-blocking factor 1 n=1 Tax=Brachionus plicatilis TaxID=10195 RepID=A0A3M7QPI0_BRAPC|nr:Progesterone-induced-blocking factor 1 [Brachionus plicatilis]
MLHQLSESANDKTKIYDEDMKKLNSNSIDSQKLYYELADTKSQLQQANFKKDNYDRIKFERDDFEKKLADSEIKNSKNLASLQVLTKERDDLSKEVNQLKQEISLLRQDKDYLHKQFVETQAKCQTVENKLEQTQKLYEDAKISKEELYEKYMSARDGYKNEYELKFNQELSDLKLKTNQEIEKLRESTKEFYEREIRNLRESKEVLVQEREKNELNFKEISIKYQEAVNELRLVQVSCENKVSELKSELKMKSFELERAQMLNEEHVNNHQKVLIENEKLQKKIEVIQNEFYGLQLQNDKRFLELENDLNEKKSRLENYEKVENEMDAVIKQVAESSENGDVNEADAEKILLSYGYGTNLMMNSKRRIQQNVHLTKRVLHLEQLNTSLRIELNKERASSKEIQDQLEVARNVIENTKQPHEFLVRSIQAKETQLKKQQNTIGALKAKIDEISSEKESLIKKQNEMTADIEKLIRHNEELIYIQDELRRNGLLSKNFQLAGSKNHSKSTHNIDLSNPRPVMFTSRVNRTNNHISPNRAYRIDKSPNQKRVYTIDRNINQIILLKIMLLRYLEFTIFYIFNHNFVNLAINCFQKTSTVEKFITVDSVHPKLQFGTIFIQFGKKLTELGAS